MLRKGEWVWVESSIGVPIGARVKVTKTGQQLLVDDEGQEHSLAQDEGASLRVMHPTSVEGVDDMIRLGDLNEAGLLRNLLVRHRQGVIYTYTGSVLVAVNPYQELPLYTADQVRLYHGRRLGELPPHVFAIADACYFNMRRHRRNQCCIISGESGAGKTESTKLVLQFLAAVSGQHSWVEQQILEANPILEAFGNAKTVRNDNSSRFGKYVEIFFSSDGVIEGARVEQYLLEKSRVCHQAAEERNYHIFYCMLAGMTQEQKNNLSLKDATHFSFLKRGDCIDCDGRDDAKDYTRIRSAMKILTFSDNQCWDILKLLASLLHLGNVSFTGTVLNNMESSDVKESDHFNMAAKLLEVQNAALAESLTHRSFLTNREHVSKPLSCEQASDCRDAFVKAIYGKMFIWIVGRINSAIHKTSTNGPKYVRHSIGLLDIFGFENFTSNSFEQLCINFANEQLQQFFVGHIFKLEQEEYKKEDIVWKNITFSDNQQTLDLLAGKALNLLALIDEESHFPKGTDVTMLNKMNKHHEKSKIYIASKSTHDMEFGIRHFAGVVYYDSKGFLEKNRDAISSDILKLIEKSTNKLLRQIFETELNRNVVKSTNKKIQITPKSSLRAQTEGKKPVTTLSAQFRLSLDSLMKALTACQPFFIRCFKPNEDKESKNFDRDLCMRQLRYSGMIDTIRIRKLGYPIRHTFREFLQRYRVLLKTTLCDPKTETAADCCDAICRAVITREDGWRIGTTKIFLKDAHDSFLEQEREQELNRKALIIQRVMLGLRDRKSFVKKKKAALVVQKYWRAYRERKYYRKIQHGFARLGSKVRGRQAELHFQRKREAAVTLQARVRGHLARKSFGRQRRAVTVLQAHTRGMLARKSVNKIRTDAFLSAQEREAQERTALELQKRLEDVLNQSKQAAADPEPVSENELTFGFLAASVAVRGREGQAPEGFEDLEKEPTEPEQTEEMETIVETPEPEPASTPEPEPAAAALPQKPPVEERYDGDSDDEDDQDDNDDDSDEHAFSKFSALHFRGSATHTHITQRLRQPLLCHDDEGDALACLTVWWIILRFMGDIPEPKYASRERNTPSASPTPHYLGRQGRRLSHLVGLDQKVLRKNRKKSLAGTGNRRASTIAEEPEVAVDGNDILIGEGPTLDRPMTSLEQLHIIVGYAISRPDIRDEIYCQICKQLVNNKNQKSSLRGWILLSICLGIFPPTELLMKYLERFIHRGHKSYGPYCAERLRRTVANGLRNEPPCWIEFEATKSKKPMTVSVSLMDGTSETLPVDSSCTSAEVCQDLAKKVGLKDTYGFSLYIGLYEKVWSLGNGAKHVMDAVSQCEQEVKRKGEEEQHTPFRLYFRKELFTPWHESMADPVSTQLIYKQVIRGLKSGEYQSSKEDDFVQLAAKHYFVLFGSDNSIENAKKVVEECIPTSLIETRSQRKWIELIKTAHLQGSYVHGRKSKESLRAEVVDFARQMWPIYFSKFYEVTMISGPPLPQSSFIVAINWSGISFQDDKDRTLLVLSYPEVTRVSISSDPKHRGQTMTLATVGGEFELKSVDAGDMAELIQMYLDGLRERSVYAVALQDINRPDDVTFLSCKRGDLLVMLKDGEYAPERGWIKATNERTVNTGAIATDTILVLPTLSKPSETTLSQLNLRSGEKKSALQPALQREEAVAPMSLKEFSYEFFRQPGKEGGRPGQARGKEKLWAISREPLRSPLLSSLAGNSDLSQMACLAFTAILKYMGDYPIKHVRSPVELTDQIFGPATEHEALQDEIYCQIMRQMTNNSSRMSMDYGWQLMWLCSGLFPPSKTLLRHTQRFLESRPREPLAADCLQRIQGMLRMEARKLPPHQVEVEAIQQSSSQIFHKVHFPNDTAELFEVTSTTRIRDLCRSIASQLSLTSADGYGFFMKTTNKLLALNDQQYFFDSLRKFSEQPKKPKKGKEAAPATAPYLVLFVRKLWFNVTPGRDLIADLMFHFPQEMPKYLRGYHMCTKEEMISLAGLLFRVQVDTDRSQFVMIPRMLKQLVPADQMKIMSPDDWKKHIISAYNKQAGSTMDEAKVAFLKAISAWPTFGCAFFEVKQTSEPSYPTIMRIAISKQGVHFIDPKTKELLVMHPFSRITNWSSGSTYFHLTIGNLVRGNTMLCETSMGHKMDDLLTSYVNMYENQRQAVRPRNQLFRA